MVTIVTDVDRALGVDRPDALSLLIPDGWEVLGRLRADEKTADLRVLILTAHAQDETKARANAGGADAFLSKPFRPNDLRVIVQQLLVPQQSESTSAVS